MNSFRLNKPSEPLFVLKEHTPRKIIESICIAGWPDEYIQNYPENPNSKPLQELISFPQKDPDKWNKNLEVLISLSSLILSYIVFISNRTIHRRQTRNNFYLS